MKNLVARLGSKIKEESFTLVELLASMATITVLVGATLTAVTYLRGVAHEKGDKIRVAQFYMGNFNYRQNTGKNFPTNDGDVTETTEAVKTAIDGGYLKIPHETTIDIHGNESYNGGDLDEEGNLLDSHGSRFYTSTTPLELPPEERPYWNFWGIGKDKTNNWGHRDSDDVVGEEVRDDRAN